MVALLINLLVLVLIAVVVFLVAKYIMAEAEAPAIIRQLVLLILLVLFLIATINLIGGHPLWGPMVVVGP